MPDATNAGIPQPGGQLSGDVSRQAAILRLKKQQEVKGQGQPPSQMVGPPKMGK